MAAAMLSIEGSGAGPYYVVNKSGPYPLVMSQHATLAQAQRSTLSTADAILFDKGVAYSALGLEGVQPAP